MSNADNKQRTSRGTWELAQLSFDGWRTHYPARVISDQPEMVKGLQYRSYGTLGVLITGEGPSAITFRIAAPYAGYLRGENPVKTLYKGEQEIAQYRGGLNPLLVFADLEENELVELEALATEVKRIKHRLR